MCIFVGTYFGIAINCVRHCSQSHIIRAVERIATSVGCTASCSVILIALIQRTHVTFRAVPDTVTFWTFVAGTQFPFYAACVHVLVVAIFACTVNLRRVFLAVVSNRAPQFIASAFVVTASFSISCGAVGKLTGLCVRRTHQNLPLWACKTTTCSSRCTAYVNVIRSAFWCFAVNCFRLASQDFVWRAMIKAFAVPI